MSSVVLDPHLADVLFDGASSPIDYEVCPTPQELWDALDPEQVPTSLRYRVLKHCARCPACAQDLQITKVMREGLAQANQAQATEAQVFQDSSAQLATFEHLPMAKPKLLWPRFSEKGAKTSPKIHSATPPPQSSPSRGSWLRPAATIGTICALAAALAVLVSPRKPTSDVTFRGETGRTQAAAPAQAGPMNQHASGYAFQNGRVSWPAGSGSVSAYELEIVDSSFEHVCTLAGLKPPVAHLDPSNCPGLDLRKVFYWKVKTHYRDGSVHASRFISQTPR